MPVLPGCLFTTRTVKSSCWGKSLAVHLHILPQLFADGLGRRRVVGLHAPVERIRGKVDPM